MVELQNIRAQLEQIVREGVSIPAGLKEQVTPHDAYNLAQGLEIQAVALGTLAACTVKVHQAQVALDQMTGGTYGICIACEDPISEKRIFAHPWSPFCVRCQGKLDQHELPDFDYLAA
jgi:DnaK suppressor protein